MARKERVASEIRQHICQILQMEIKDPRIGFTTITDIKVSADLKAAKVYFTSHGDDKQKKASHDALKSAAGFIRSQLASRMNMRYTPALDFRRDESIEYGAKIDEIFKKIQEEREKDAS